MTAGDTQATVTTVTGMLDIRKNVAQNCKMAKTQTVQPFSATSFLAAKMTTTVTKPVPTWL